MHLRFLEGAGQLRSDSGLLEEPGRYVGMDTDQPGADFDMLAGSFGVSARSVGRADELADVVEEALAGRRATACACTHHWARAALNQEPVPGAEWRRLNLAAGAGAAVRAVERVEEPHVVVGELEVEQLGVGADAFLAAGLGDDDGLVLDRPAEHDLGGRAAEAFGDGGDRRVLEAAAACEWAVGLEHDPVLQAVVEQPAPVVERAELHLVDGRHARRTPDQPRQPVTAEVADADRSRQPAFPERLELDATGERSASGSGQWIR